MRSFKILELSTIGPLDPLTYKLDERTGFYMRTSIGGINIPDSERGLLDILFDRPCKIIKVLRESGVEFKIGDRFTADGVITNIIIENFSIVRNKMYVNNISFTLDSITKYTPPVVTHVPTRSTNVSGKINNFIELQTKIETENPKGLKLHNFTYNSTENLSSFLRNFILTYNNNHHTLYGDANNANEDNIQTKAHKRRSLADIYLLCKHYYPDCNLHEVIQWLYIDGYGHIPGFGSLICQTINKRVWWNYGTPRADHKTTYDEFGNPWRWYIDKLAEKSVIEVETPTDLVKIKQIFKKGIKFKSLITNKTVTITNEEFYDGLKFIIVIQSDGSRKIVYDKVNKKLAQIIK